MDGLAGVAGYDRFLAPVTSQVITPLLDAAAVGPGQRGLVLGQPEDVQARIRAAFDRLAGQYATADGLDVPISVKVASGVRP